MATYYFWDEIEDNVIEEYDENGNTIVEYTTEPTLYGSVLTQDRGGQVRHYHFDGQGNTTELTDENGNVTDTRKYSAFGEVTESTGTTEFPYQYLARFGFAKLLAAVYIRGPAILFSQLARWGHSPSPLNIFAFRAPLQKPKVDGRKRGLPPVLSDPQVSDLKGRFKPPCGNCTVGGLDLIDIMINDPAVQRCWKAFLERLKQLEVPGKDPKQYCKDLTIHCEDCRGHPEDGKWVDDGVPKGHRIILCTDKLPFTDLDSNKRATTFCHELIHALQSSRCRGTSLGGSTACQVSLRSELQAYYCSGDCIGFDDCFRRAVDSAGEKCNTPAERKEAEDWFNKEIDGLCQSIGIGPKVKE